MMTDRQRLLINYLLWEFNRDNKRYISKDAIQQNVIDINGYFAYTITPTKRKGDSYRLQITKDVDCINRSSELECSYLIISNSKGYKIATRDELIKWAEKQKRYIEKKCIKRNNMLRKYKLDGQFDLDLVEIKPFI